MTSSTEIEVGRSAWLCGRQASVECVSIRACDHRSLDLPSSKSLLRRWDDRELALDFDFPAEMLCVFSGAIRTDDIQLAGREKRDACQR